MLLLVGGTFSLVNTSAYGQSECDEALTMAQEEYDQGFFDRATFRLDTCLRSDAFNEEQEKEAYLLLGKIYYANLQIDQAKDSVRKLLSKNPAYKLNPQEHKPGFIDLYQEVQTEFSLNESFPHVRSGFWLSVGGGPGEGNVECDCPGLARNDPWNGGGSGGSITIAVGGTTNPKLQLGAELSVWERRSDIDNNRITSGIGLLTFIAKYYPSQSGNFYLKGGMGVGTGTLEREVNIGGDTIKLESSGLGMQFGLGYDILLGKMQQFALTPYLNLSVLYAETDVQVLQFRNNDGLLDTLRLEGPDNPSFFQVGVLFSMP